MAANYFSSRFELPVTIFLRNNHHLNSSITRLSLDNGQIKIVSGRKISINSLIVLGLQIFRKFNSASPFIAVYEYDDLSHFGEQEVENSILSNTHNHIFYIRGYFADMKYFEPESVNELNRKLESYVKTQNKLDWPYLESDGISLHIRGGDYLQDPDHYGVLAKIYYQNAIAISKEKFPDLQVRVWSDDSIFARTILSELITEFDIVFMDAPELKDPVLSLYLMSKSNFHILSLSTFSYWSAILSENAKVVIYPGHNRQMLPYIQNVPNFWISLAPSWFVFENN